MQIKITVSYHLTPVSMITMKKTTTNVGRDVEKRETLPVWWECKLCSHYGKHYEVPQEVKNKNYHMIQQFYS